MNKQDFYTLLDATINAANKPRYGCSCNKSLLADAAALEVTRVVCPYTENPVGN